MLVFCSVLKSRYNFEVRLVSVGTNVAVGYSAAFVVSSYGATTSSPITIAPTSSATDSPSPLAVVTALSASFTLNYDYTSYNINLEQNNLNFRKDIAKVLSLDFSQIVIESVTSYQVMKLSSRKLYDNESPNTVISFYIPAVALTNLFNSRTTVLPSSSSQQSLVTYYSSLLTNNSNNLNSAFYRTGTISKYVVPSSFTVLSESSSVAVCADGKTYSGNSCPSSNSASSSSLSTLIIIGVV